MLIRAVCSTQSPAGALFAVVLVLCVSAALPPVSLAGAEPALREIESEGFMRDALLDREPLSFGDRLVLDFNEDGDFNIADLIRFLRDREGPPRATFVTAQSRAREDAGEVYVEVLFDKHFVGELAYNVTEESTAEPGADYQELPGAVSVAGESARISIPLIDSAELTGARALVLELADGDGYSLGGLRRHSLFITDSGGVWTGVLNQEGGALPIELEVRMQDGDAEVRFLHTSGGPIPPSEPPETGWPATEAEFDGSSFTITIEGLPVSTQASSRLGATFTRALTLWTGPTDKFNVFNETTLEGFYTETLTPEDPAFSYLETQRSGTFFLQRRLEKNNVPPAALAAAE